MPDLSIILPTCDRAPLLERALAAIEQTVRRPHEVVVVDGASSDGTADVLARAKAWMGDRLRVIREERREGFVRAANKGFRAARGTFVTWLNDDVRPLEGALDSAVGQLESSPSDVGVAALFHRWHAQRNIAYEYSTGGSTYRLCHIRGTFYANFGVARRETFARLGYFDERYFFCAADPDFSLKAWHAGLRVVPAYGAAVDHDEHEDDRRATDSVRAGADNRRLFAKWDLPAKNPRFNDFDAARPCTLRGLRASGGMEEAA
ncbi:MAG: glycosyltransferase family 2 protein [Phycisphaerae bacterium]|nr:glycosyltransferase [Tepidisphaeraceae bacterium]